MNEWMHYRPMFFAVKLVTGEKVCRPVMRRKVDGRWEYRAMTPDEMADYVSNDIW